MTTITEKMVDEAIAAEFYHQFPGTLTVVCCLKLNNGFAVVGEAHCLSLEEFSEEIGRRVACANAREKVFPLLGFLAREVSKFVPTPAEVPNG